MSLHGVLLGKAPWLENHTRSQGRKQAGKDKLKANAVPEEEGRDLQVAELSSSLHFPSSEMWWRVCMQRRKDW